MLNNMLSLNVHILQTVNFTTHLRYFDCHTLAKMYTGSQFKYLIACLFLSPFGC